MATISINLPRAEKNRLEHLALSYGLSLSELSRRIFEELRAKIYEESFNDYESPKSLKASFARGLSDWRSGRTSSQL